MLASLRSTLLVAAVGLAGTAASVAVPGVASAATVHHRVAPHTAVVHTAIVRTAAASSYSSPFRAAATTGVKRVVAYHG